MLCLETDVLQEFGIVVHMKKPLHDRKSLGVHRACVAEFCFVLFVLQKNFFYLKRRVRESERQEDKKIIHLLVLSRNGRKGWAGAD